MAAGRGNNADSPCQSRRKPNKPRIRPAYQFFVAEERDKIRAACPNLKFHEVMQVVGGRWSEACTEVKNKYHILAVEYAKIKGTASPKDPNLPKPIGQKSYIAFCAEERPKIKSIHTDFTPSQISKELGRLWAKASVEIKKKYNGIVNRDLKTQKKLQIVVVKESRVYRNSPSGFFTFNHFQRPKVLLLHPHFNKMEQFQELSRRWNNLDAWLKLQYKLLANRKFKSLEQEMKAYRQHAYIKSISAQGQFCYQGDGQNLIGCK